MSENYPNKFDAIWIVIALALLAYVLPWVFNPTVTLSLGAYDFAEFLTKRPFGIPIFKDTTYWTVFALRGQLFILTALLALRMHRQYFTAHWWSHVIVCMVLVIAQLPPLTFLGNLGDSNQQQQAMLALMSLIIVAIGSSGIIWEFRHPTSLALVLLGIVSAIYGLINAIDIMNDYSLSTNIGVGGIILVIIYILLGLWSLYNIRSHVK